LDSLEKRPRGFQGRPFLALVVAVGLGFSLSYLTRWLHLNETFASILGPVLLVLIGLAWYHLERP